MRLVGLLNAATSGRLLIYAGAGLSLASGLPTGRQLAQEIHRRLTEMGMELSAVDADDLLAVADGAAGFPGGDAAVRSIALSAFPFVTAPPSPAHRALALLLLEGALQVLTTNWDLCVETAASPERVATVVTDGDRLHVQAAALYKLHGSAERPASLLITSDQLKGAPLWSQAATLAALSQATVVFLGIGDIAPYVRHGLQVIVDALGVPSNVAVVSPSIEGEWGGSKWAELLPSLPPEGRWGLTSDDFCEGVLSVWVNAALSDVRATATAIGVAQVSNAFDRFHASLREHGAECVASWLRRCAFAPEAGRSVLRDGHTGEALLALALLLVGDALGDLPAHGPIRAASRVLDVLVAPKRTSGLGLAEEAHRRAVRYRRSSLLGPGEDLSVICSGHTGPLPSRGAASLPVDLVDSPQFGSIVSGAGVELIAAHSVIEAAA